MDEVAIVGMACLFPGAPDIRTFWRNIVNKVDAISDPPDDWEGEAWYDPDSKASDRIYVKKAGFLKDLSRFDPIKYGILPKAVDGAEPEQWLSLKVAHEAMEDAGVPDIPINRDSTEVIMGRGTFVNRGYATMCHHSIGIDQALSLLKDITPDCAEEKLAVIKEKLKACVPPFGSDTAPGLVTSIMTGRIANRLDLKGSSYAVDAACSSSLLAVEHGYYDLLSGRCDAALVGGINLGTHHPVQLLFSQLGAASRSQKIRPFDELADGTLLGEGVGMVVLKRLGDAERDGNRIYAVIRGVGSSSDGKGTSVVAPRVEGEELAIRRAYERAGFSAQTVGLIEAHGTGIPLGDATEIEALTNVFGGSTETASCAIGSVKSMLGHLLPAAGMAGLIKAVLSVYHKTLPPTINCDRPDPKLKLSESPFYVNTEVRPWVLEGAGAPRRAGVNAFGFGGSNAHVVVEEYTSQNEGETEDFDCNWETELCVLQAPSRSELVAEAERVRRYLGVAPFTILKDLAYTLNGSLSAGCCRLAIVATSVEDLNKKLSHAITRLKDQTRTRIKDKSGIYYFDAPIAEQGKLAFLFPGEGSQYVGMLGDLCRHFPEVRDQFDLLSRARGAHPELELYRDSIFPPPAFNDAERAAAEVRLGEMDNAVTAVMTADKAMLTVLEQLKVNPEAVAGHSSGEIFSFAASGASELSRGYEEKIMGYLLLGHKLMERIEQEDAIPNSPLITVGAVHRDLVDGVIEESGGDLLVAMDNCPNQLVLCCRDSDAVPDYIRKLKGQGAICQVLPFSLPYHTPLFEPARKHLKKLFDWGTFSSPKVVVYSCLSAQPLPKRDGEEIRRFGIDQWFNPVRFRETIEAMYGDGVRIFLEVGPSSQLTGFVKDILRKQECLAVAVNVEHRSGITQLHHALGLLAAHGVGMDLNYLYKRRCPQELDLDATEAAQGKPERPEPVLPLGIPLLSLKGVSIEWLTGKKLVAEHTLDRKREEQRPAPASAPAPVLEDAPPPAPRKSEAPRPGNNGGTLPSQPQQHRVSLPQLGNPRGHIMANHFQNMERFLDDQHAIFQGFMFRGTSAGAQIPVIPPAPPITFPPPSPPSTIPVSSPTGETGLKQENPVTERPPVDEIAELVRRLPFVDTILSHTPGEEVAVLRELSLEEDIFLFDHTFGRDVSVTDKKLYGLPVMPLTVSMEIMAEAGALLFPGNVFVSMKNIRAYRWITVEEKTFLLKMEAKRTGPGRAMVRLRKALDETGKTAVGLPILEAIVEFAERYPDPPPLEEFPLTGRRPSQIPKEALYEEVMFHGPCFRGIKSVDWWGEEGVEGTMEVLPTNILFNSCPDPQFMFDTVLLDAAGQLMAFFYNDDMSKGVDLYPFRVKELNVYGPPLPAQTPILGRSRTWDLGNHQLRSNIDMVDPDGRYHMRLVHWEDREFRLPLEFNRTRFKPREIYLSTVWEEAVAGLGGEDEVVCCRMDDYPEELLHGHNGVWLNVLVHLALSGAELDQWWKMTGPQGRRVEWLLGRIAAKDAVRHILKKQYNLDLCLADIAITADEFRRPLAGGAWVQNVKDVPGISISHKSGVGVALAAEGKSGCGIDLEVLASKKKGIDKFVLVEEERTVLGALLSPNDDEWLLRSWCAKEAVGKALGRGLPAGPKDLTVRSVDPKAGALDLEPAGKLLEALPEFKGRCFRAVTRVEGERIVAVSLRS